MTSIFNLILETNFMSKLTDEKKTDTKSTSRAFDFALGKENFKLLAIGFGIILLGFILMMGSSNNDPKVFNADIYSFKRIILAPLVVLAGFIFEIYAIMKKPKQE